MYLRRDKLYLTPIMLLLSVLLSLSMSFAHEDEDPPMIHLDKNCWLDQDGNWWEFETDMYDSSHLRTSGHRHDRSVPFGSWCDARMFTGTGGLRPDKTGRADITDHYRAACDDNFKVANLSLDYRGDVPIITGLITINDRQAGPFALTEIDCGQHP